MSKLSKNDWLNLNQFLSFLNKFYLKYFIIIKIKEDNDVDDIDDEEDIGEDEETDDFIENGEGLLFGEDLLARNFVLLG